MYVAYTSTALKPCFITPPPKILLLAINAHFLFEINMILQNFLVIKNHSLTLNTKVMRYSPVLFLD
jgi:hypothetical protein